MFASVRTADHELPVLRGELLFPLLGAWTASLECEAGGPTPKGQVAAVVLGRELQGHVLDAFESPSGSVNLRLAGGQGGLSRNARPQEYRNLRVRAVLEQVLGEAGEHLAPSSSKTMLERVLPRWVCPARPVGSQLDALALALGANWRVLPEGGVWFGEEDWPEVEAVPTGAHPELRCLEFAPSTLELLPGTALGGRKITAVSYLLEAARVSARAFLSLEASGDPLRGGLWSLLEGEPGLQRLLWLGACPAAVVQDRGNGLADLRPESGTFPSLTAVPLAGPAPGARVSSPAGAKCHLLWGAGAFGTAPLAALWEPASPSSEVRPVARVGDRSDAGKITFQVVPAAPPVKPEGVLTISYLPPDGGPPQVVVLTIAGLLGSSGSFDLAAVLKEGSPHLALPAG